VTQLAANSPVEQTSADIEMGASSPDREDSSTADVYGGKGNTTKGGGAGAHVPVNSVDSPDLPDEPVEADGVETKGGVVTAE